MKSVLSLCIASLFFVACNQDLKTEEAATAETPNQQEFAIIIHGGAGTILKKNMTDSMEQAYKAKLTEAIKTGHEILKNGGSARESNPPSTPLSALRLVLKTRPVTRPDPLPPRMVLVSRFESTTNLRKAFDDNRGERGPAS